MPDWSHLHDRHRAAREMLDRGTTERCRHCGGPLTIAAYHAEPYCPDIACYTGRLTKARIARTEPAEPTLSVVLGRVVALLVSVAIAVALWAGATQYGGWHPALAGVAAGVIFAATHDTLSAKVK